MTCQDISPQYIEWKSVAFSCIAGANAIEFIIKHAEVSIAFVQENKIDYVHKHCFSLSAIFFAFYVEQVH